jgi:hypothetical protein
MQILFTKLQYPDISFVIGLYVRFGKIKSIDPSDFTTSIALKTSIQQDPQEYNNFKLFLHCRFFKLLVTMLESGYDTCPSLKSMLQHQFQGKYKYTTTCLNCNTPSHTESYFNEIELSIKGNSTLEDCLQEYTKEEKLTGKVVANNEF